VRNDQSTIIDGVQMSCGFTRAVCGEGLNGTKAIGAKPEGGPIIAAQSKLSLLHGDDVGELEVSEDADIYAVGTTRIKRNGKSKATRRRIERLLGKRLYHERAEIVKRSCQNATITVFDNTSEMSFCFFQRSLGRIWDGRNSAGTAGVDQN
jgi:hypothetical protein